MHGHVSRSPLPRVYRRCGASSMLSEPAGRGARAMRAPKGLLAAVLVGFGTAAAAETLPLPEHLISLDSERGSKLLIESEAVDAYWPLSIQFVTQKNQAFCGVATIVMLLNALDVPAPTTPEFEPFRTFTQDNVLNEATEKILPQAILARQGMTLDQLGELI